MTKKPYHHVLGIYPNTPPPWRQRQRTFTLTSRLLLTLTTTTTLIATKHLINNNTNYLPLSYKNNVPQGHIVPQGDIHHYKIYHHNVPQEDIHQYNPLIAIPLLLPPLLRPTHENHTSPYHETSPTKTNPTTKTHASNRKDQASSTPNTITIAAKHTTYDDNVDDDYQTPRQGHASSHNQLTPKHAQNDQSHLTKKEQENKISHFYLCQLALLQRTCQHFCL